MYFIFQSIHSGKNYCSFGPVMAAVGPVESGREEDRLKRLQEAISQVVGERRARLVGPDVVASPPSILPFAGVEQSTSISTEIIPTALLATVSSPLYKN